MENATTLNTINIKVKQAMELVKHISMVTPLFRHSARLPVVNKDGEFDCSKTVVVIFKHRMRACTHSQVQNACRRAFSVRSLR